MLLPCLLPRCPVKIAQRRVDDVAVLDDGDRVEVLALNNDIGQRRQHVELRRSRPEHVAV